MLRFPGTLHTNRSHASFSEPGLPLSSPASLQPCWLLLLLLAALSHYYLADCEVTSAPEVTVVLKGRGQLQHLLASFRSLELQQKASFQLEVKLFFLI